MSRLFKLHPDESSLDYSDALNRAASDAERHFQHVHIEVDQSYVIRDLMYQNDKVGEIELDARSLRRFLSSEVCANLQTFRLQLDECIGDFTARSTDGGRALAPLGQLKNLQALRMTNPFVDSVQVLSAMLNPDLREVVLWNMSIEAEARPWSRQSCKDLVRCIAPLTKLVKLGLTDCHLRDEDLEELLSNKPDLRSLDLSGGFGTDFSTGNRDKPNTRYITDEGLRIIARLCPHLQELTLSDQKGPTMAGLEHLLRGLTNLRCLSVGIPLDGSLSRILPLSTTLLLFSADVRRTVPPFDDDPPFLVEAAIATGGRTLVKTRFYGLVELSGSAPAHILLAREQSKARIDEAWERLENPSVINEWENEGWVAESSSEAEPSSTGTQASCSWIGCPNRGGDSNLQACSRCKKELYCGKMCQKSHWETHKHKCVSVETPRHEVADFTIQSIQSAIDEASAGDAVILKEGTYEGPDAVLTVNKPLKLLGCSRGMDSIKLVCKLVVQASGSSSDRKGVVTLADFELVGPGEIEDNSYKAINIYNVRVSCKDGCRDDAFTTNQQSGKTLFLDSDIHGGSDGLHIGDSGVHLKRTRVRFAQNRGIFSRCHFVIEDVAVDGCGGYGIKGTAGWTEKGDNFIQPGPWSSFGGPTGGFGGPFGF